MNLSTICIEIMGDFFGSLVFVRRGEHVIRTEFTIAFDNMLNIHSTSVEFDGVYPVTAGSR